jgi:hypothetical protein
MRSVLLNPRQKVTIPGAFGHFCLERLSLNACEIQKTLIDGTRVVVGTVCSLEFGTAFVEHAWQDHVSAQARADAAGRVLGEVGCGEVHRLGFKVSCKVNASNGTGSNA